MSGIDIESLKRLRPFLLLVEMAGLLHDIGKLSAPVEIEPWKIHVLIPDMELSLKSFNDYTDKTKHITQYKRKKRSGWQISVKSLQDICLFLSDEIKSFFSKKFKDLFPNEELSMIKRVSLEIENLKISELLIRHHSNYRIKAPKDSPIAQADTLDAIEDRDTRVYEPESQYLYSPLGMVKGLSADNNSKRSSVYKLIEKFIEAYEKKDYAIARYNLMQIKKFMSSTYSISVIPVNDTTLWNHSYMTASIAKALAISSLPYGRIIEVSTKLKEEVSNVLESLKKQSHIEGFREISNQGNINRYHVLISIEDKERKNGHWLKKEISNRGKVRYNDIRCISRGNMTKVLAIQFKGREFITDVYRFPDFDGRKIVIRRIQRRLKDLIEFEIPLGNCVYEDVDGLFFLVPYIEKEVVEGVVKEIIRDETCGLLPYSVEIKQCTTDKGVLRIGKVISALRKEFEDKVYIENKESPEWIKEWSSIDDKEVCQVCQKMPATKKDYYEDRLCDWCYNTRSPKVYIKDERLDGLFEDCLVVFKRGNRGVNFIYDPDNGEWRHFEIQVNGLPREYEAFAERMEGGIYKFTFKDREGVGEVVEKLKNEGYDISVTGFPTAPDEAKYIDEVMDIENRYALIIGRLHPAQKWLDGEYIETTFSLNKKPKPPSPSRMMRVIEEFNQFIEEAKGVSEGIIEEGKRLYFEARVDPKIRFGFIEADWKDNLMDKILEEKGIEDKERKRLLSRIMHTNRLEVAIRDNKYLETTEFFPPSEGIETDGVIREYIERYTKDNGKFIFREEGEEKKIKVSPSEFCSVPYKRIKEVYHTPDEFIFLVPRDHALNVVEVFRKRFQEGFAKVLGRLSLRIGVVFAQHKFPLYLVFDAGKRLKQKFDQYDTIMCRITDEKPSWRFYLGNGKVLECPDDCLSISGIEICSPIKTKILHIILKQRKKGLIMDSFDAHIPIELPIKESEVKKDVWYPYLKERSIAETDLLNTDTDWHPNLFGFLYMESSQRRFAIHQALNIFLLDDAKGISNLYGRFNQDSCLLRQTPITGYLSEVCKVFRKMEGWTPIYNILTTYTRSLDGWQAEPNSDMGRSLAESLVANIGAPLSKEDRERLIDALVRGYYKDCLHLFSYILKKKWRDKG
jgi:hypothetical protein